MDDVESVPPLAISRSRHWTFFIAGIALLILGPVWFLSQIRWKNLGPAWYVPILSFGRRLSVDLICAAAVQALSR